MEKLAFYVTEKQLHEGMPLHEWLLEEAQEMGIPGGSVFRAIGGYGRHGRLHEETFFELAGELAVMVEFILEDAVAEQFMQRLREQNWHVFYVRHKVESGMV